MKVPALIFCIITFLSTVPPAVADEVVHFESAPVVPSALQQRRAEEQGQPLPTPHGTPLIGYLTRPPGNGVAPAVILLHGCGGIHASVKEQWPERLASWGYAALVVDSFTTRGIKNSCKTYLPERVYDAYGALNFLSKDPHVDANRIVLMGFSAGGITTLQATKAGGDEQLMEQKFKAAVAYYPVCSATDGDATIPTLILSGELDDWSLATRCERRVEKLKDGTSHIQLNIYPNAYHGFDSPQNAGGRMVLGHREEYNAVEAQNSFNDVRDFLTKELGK